MRFAHNGGRSRTHGRNQLNPFCAWVRIVDNGPVTQISPPPAQGLYDPSYEHDACGVGFVAHIKGRRSHAIVRQALQVLINLEHRGACGCEANTGDGAGILMQMPDRFLRGEAAALGITLPPERGYGAGLIFLPHDEPCRRDIEGIFERIVVEEGQELLGWRDVPTDHRALGPSAIAVEPVFRQILIGRGPGLPAPGASAEGDAAFERKLFVIRKRVEHAVDALGCDDRRFFYVVSLSSRTLVYKGMLTANQIAGMFPDLVESGGRVGAGAGAPALQHQHVPVLAAGAPLPLHRAQRRDQHAARQHQLDEGARGAAVVRGARRGPGEDPADHPRGGQRHAPSSTTSSSCW